MSSHAFALLVYCLIASAALALELLSKRKGTQMASLEQVLSWVMRTRMGRMGVMTGWVWVGLHYFAR